MGKLKTSLWVLLILLAAFALSGYMLMSTIEKNVITGAKLDDNAFNIDLKIYMSMIGLTGCSYVLAMRRKLSMKNENNSRKIFS